MTVPSAVNRNDYIGTGAVSTYAYSFKVFVATSISVVVADTDGNETTLTLTTDYTLTGVGETSGGNVVLVNSGQVWLTGGFLTTGYTITIRRIRELKQQTDIRNQGDYFPEAHEDEFDKQIMVDQQQQDELDRSVKVAVTETGVDATLPVASADAYIGWNANGDGLTNKTPTSLSDSGPNINGGDAGKIINVNSGENAYQLSTLKALLAAITSGGLSINTTLSVTEALTMSSIFKAAKGDDVASAGALTLGDDGNFFDITGTTNITSITAKTAGTVVVLQFDGILTVTDGSNLKIRGDFVTTAESAMMLVCDGTNWYEISRAGFISTVRDADGDTGVEAERTADDDILYLKTGGTDRLIADASGNITKPTQPAFRVNPASEQSNIAINSDVDVAMGTEVFDIGGNFASDVFTAPVTGKYQLSLSLHLIAVDSAATEYVIRIVTSNRTYAIRIDGPIFAGDGDITIMLSHLCDMDVNDTAKAQIRQIAGTQQTDIDDGDSVFSGFLAT